MKIHEYQAKAILSRYGVTTPRGEVAFTKEEAREAAQRLKSKIVVVKAQIHAGGRGKAGGVKLARSADEAADIASQMPREVNPDRPLQRSAIAAAEHDRRLAHLAQQPGQRQHGRGLAGAADMIVADAQHRDAGVEAAALHALAGDEAIERAERRQQQR